MGNKVLIIEDHPLLRAGLKALLGDIDPGIVPLEASTLGEGRRLVAAHPDIALVVLDLHLPDSPSDESWRTLRSASPGLPVLVTSAGEDPALARRLLAEGAMGFLPKSASMRTVRAAIGLVLGGEVYVPPFLVGGGGMVAACSLTPRQREVAKALCQGLSNQQIAERLGLSENTVRVHVSAVLRAAEAESRRDVPRLSAALGLAEFRRAR